MRLVVLLIVLAGFASGVARAQPAAAALEADRLPAGAAAATLLHVTAAGRFAIIAHSASGTAISLVDMITGPSPEAGAPGSADGRLDLLLDVGTYKIRTRSAAAAKGDVQLRVVPSRDAASPALLPGADGFDATLADGQQRSFWFAVPANQSVRIEAAGRALADLRLWRDGRDLLAARAEETEIEPTHGHRLRDLRFSAALPAGTYLVTAYGGPELPWADGVTEQPFHVRAGASDALRPGWVAGRIGPFGSALFTASGSDDLVRLSMAGPASLVADDQMADIDVRSRVQAAELQVPAGLTAPDHLVEVRGQEGAAYQLRSLGIGGSTRLAMLGSFWVTANTVGFGGDDVPATLVLARADPQGGFTVEASNAPEIGPGHAWHQRFNLAGEVGVLFHATVGGRIEARVAGVPARARLVALDSQSLVSPADPRASDSWDVPAGWFELSLLPAGNAAGVADVTVGPPGTTSALGPPGPSSPSVTFGVRTLGFRESLTLFGNAAPGARFGLDSRPTPIDAGQPLRVSQAAGQSLTIPLRTRPGTLQGLEIGRGPAAVSFLEDSPDAATGSATLPAPDHARVVALTWRSPALPASMPLPEPEAARPTLRDAEPYFGEFAQDDTRAFTLAVAKGGLFQVETLGRLRTRGAIGTHFSPELAKAAANGVGQNMLLQTWLRAGQYHVDVTAEASAGHAGLLASPATLLTSPALLPGLTVRAALPAGEGLLVPITIPKAGSYRLDLLGLAQIFTARLEDADGWPLAASGPLDSVTQDLAPGQYRLLVLPQPVDKSAVVRLTRIVPPLALAGHGPHALPFEASQDFTWREPAGRTDPRQPDDWRFSLAATADVTLTLTDGMEARLFGPDGAPVAHLVGGAAFSRALKPGDYRLEATSQGRNDRLDYTIRLSASQLQPGVTRSVDLPASLPFALATNRVVSLTSFGGVPVRAVLRDHAGAVLGRYGARDADWNIALSSLLPAGTYTLDLASAAPPALRSTPRNVNDAAPGAAAQQDGEADEDAGQEQTPAAETDNGAMEMGDAAPAADVAGPASARTQVTLAMPDDAPGAALAGNGGAQVAGGGVHHLALPQPQAGQLILAGAAASADVVLSLEQADGAVWHSRAHGQGLTPLLAIPADGTSGAWRLSVWAVDGDALPIQVAARVVARPALAGQPRLQPLALPGVTGGLAVAHVALPGRAMLALTADQAGVLAAFWPGHAAELPQAGLIAPQADDLWLIAPHAGKLALAVLPQGAPIVIAVPPGARAVLPPQAAPLAAWVAEAQGQPGLWGGRMMGVADGSALALAAHGDAPVMAGDAGNGDGVRVALYPVPLKLGAAVPPGDQQLAPESAALVALSPGRHALRVDLAPGTALVTGWPAADAVTVWAGRAAASRTLEGNWRQGLLVNTGHAPAAIAVSEGGPGEVEDVTPDRVMRRFFGAAGAIDVAVLGSAGQTLVVAGGGATVIGADGVVRRGARVKLNGPGRVILTHEAGFLAAWLEGAGANPWPIAAPHSVRLPQSIALAGAAMRLALPTGAPALLQLHTDSPVILVLDDGAPVPCPAGAALSRFVGVGPHSLLVVAPQDGGLSGTIALSTTAIRPARDGLGDAVAIAPGGSALFGFSLAAPARVGLAARAEPDRAALTLLDARGQTLATGASMLRDLPAGAYVLQASLPPDASTTLLRPALLGLSPRSSGPPPEVVASYRALAGLVGRKDRAP